MACELLGVGSIKQTDTHYGVKKGAYGMFNWRLKWRTKFPSTVLEYLMRIQVFDILLNHTHIHLRTSIETNLSMSESSTPFTEERKQMPCKI
jgi:hypothetical protein